MKNRQIWLRSRPNGIPQAADFDLREVELPTLAGGEFIVHNAYLSADPAMRGWIADKSTYWPRIEVGDTMRAFSVGEVLESKNPDYAVGDRVMGIFGWQEYVRLCIEEFAYDAAIDYKHTRGLDAALEQQCPDGIDAFFDNTSGAIHDAVLRRINLHARIAICGTASYASWDPWNKGPRPERHLLVKRATMRGFLTTDFAARYEEAAAALAGWIREGKLKYREDVLQGIESAPGSIEKLYSGENRGKLIIRL